TGKQLFPAHGNHTTDTETRTMAQGDSLGGPRLHRWNGGDVRRYHTGPIIRGPDPWRRGSTYTVAPRPLHPILVRRRKDPQPLDHKACLTSAAVLSPLRGNILGRFGELSRKALSASPGRLTGGDVEHSTAGTH